MLKNIDINLLLDNPHNSRVHYDMEEIEQLSKSIEKCGLLSPVTVRTFEDKYQIVFGHRRVRAARLLNWKQIRAEVGEYDDKQMLVLSLVENLDRENLSDYEKGLSLQKLLNVFKLSYDEISSLLGYSKPHICNLVRMTQLFDEDTLSRDETLFRYMHKISEHHARILLRIQNSQTRADALRFVVSNEISVRDLQRIVQKLGGLFDMESLATLHGKQRSQLADLAQIENALISEFQLPHLQDFESFAQLHSFDKEFSVFSSFPPASRFEGKMAIELETNWFHTVAPNLSVKIRDIHVRFFDNVALATLYVDRENKNALVIERGTVVFTKKDNHWKIVHEHWSVLGDRATLSERPRKPDWDNETEIVNVT